MATVDEQIQLAEEIAQEIIERLRRAAQDDREAKNLLKASRNEWMRWMQIAGNYGLGKGIAYAQRLSRDITMRSNIQKINDQFGAVVPNYKKRLETLSSEQQRRVLGYVTWYLRIAGKE